MTGDEQRDDLRRAMRVPGGQATDTPHEATATSGCLNAPSRSAERAALDIAVRTLRHAVRCLAFPNVHRSTVSRYCADALDRIRELVPDAKDE